MLLTDQPADDGPVFYDLAVPLVSDGALDNGLRSTFSMPSVSRYWSQQQDSSTWRRSGAAFQTPLELRVWATNLLQI